MASKKVQSGDRREEYVEEIVEVPDCFGFWDSEDPSCRRCKQKFLCADAMVNRRPPCFGVVYGISPICDACLDASECAEETSAKGSDNMASRKVKIRRHTVAKPVEPEPEEVEDEIEEEEEDDSYVTWVVADLRNELESRGLDTSGRKATMVKRLLADDEAEDEDEPEDEEEEEEPVVEPKVVKKVRKVSKAKAKPEPEPEPVEMVLDEDDDVSIGSIGELLESLGDGQALVATRLDVGKYQFAVVDVAAGSVLQSKATGGGLKGRAFEKEAFTEEFVTFLYEDSGSGTPWKEMTPEERYAMAEEIGAEWIEHDNARTDQMRMGLAVRKELGIGKWKPEYESRASRRALRGE